MTTPAGEGKECRCHDFPAWCEAHPTNGNKPHWETTPSPGKEGVRSGDQGVIIGPIKMISIPKEAYEVLTEKAALADILASRLKTTIGVYIRLVESGAAWNPHSESHIVDAKVSLAYHASLTPAAEEGEKNV